MKNKPKFGVSIQESLQALSSNGAVFWLFAICMIIFMGIVCLAVFFSMVKGAEEVLVPSVEGKDFTEACIEMQSKELYPKIVLRYSENPDDKGKVLEQSPKAGAIVKAGKRISLTVSRGSSVERVEDFIGLTLNDVQTRLNTLFASSAKPLIVLGDALYENNAAPAGTVLQQDPPADTLISEPVTLTLVVSKGPEDKKVAVPSLTGLSLSDIYAQMQSSNLVFDFTENAGTTENNSIEVVSQTPAQGTMKTEYSRVEAVVAFPGPKETNPSVYGIFSYSLLEYSYPMEMQLEAVPTSGKPYTIVSFSHPGGKLTVPYSVPQDTVLILKVRDKEVARLIAR